MPQINLLSPTLGKSLKKVKQKKTSQPQIATPLSKMHYPIAAILILLVISWIITSVRIGKYNNELKKLKEKEANLTINPQEISALDQKKKDLLKRQDFLERLTEKKFLWAEKLDRITELIPEGVWLTEISSEKKLNIDPVTRRSKGEESVILLKGRAVAVQIQDAIELVGQFFDKLKNDEVFYRKFKEIKLDSVKKGVFSNRDIMNFEFVCVVE